MKNKITLKVILLILVLSISLKKVQGQDKVFDKFLPKEFIAQYAGSIGFISFGINYPILKEKVNLSLHYGYVPKSMGGKLDILTTKITFKPIKLKLGDQFTLYPVNPTFFISYTLNNNWYFRWPTDQYPKNYYWWNSALRLHPGISSELTTRTTDCKFLKSITLYSELNTNDLYIASYFHNQKALSIFDILKWGLGVRVRI